MNEATAAEIAAEIRDDWTIDPETGRSNSSPEFVRLCAEVERLIRQDAFKLIGGRADLTAGLIMAQLAHVHHLAPRETPRARVTTAEAAQAWGTTPAKVSDWLTPEQRLRYGPALFDSTVREALRIAVTAAENDRQAERFKAALAAMDHEEA